MSLSGESENWKVDAYEIMSTSEAFKVGNGNLIMKKNNEYSSDFFSVEVNAVIEGEETTIQKRSVSGSETDITQTSIGTVEGSALHDENGEIISPENISDIYMIIKWREDSDTRKESIDLLNKDGFLE
ncbi:hypothetical protein FHR85_001976 [Alkalibacillus almallahensis]|nr:hypothetical protein [Alkalibacillus almallahensis]